MRTATSMGQEAATVAPHFQALRGNLRFRVGDVLQHRGHDGRGTDRWVRILCREHHR